MWETSVNELKMVASAEDFEIAEVKKNEMTKRKIFIVGYQIYNFLSYMIYI